MKHLQELPNDEGSRFIGIDDDNRHIKCIVQTDKNGFCSVYDEDGEPNFFQLVGWLPAPITPEAARALFERQLLKMHTVFKTDKNAFGHYLDTDLEYMFLGWQMRDNYDKTTKEARQ